MLVLQLIKTKFNIQSISDKHLSNEERVIINEILGFDPFFEGMTEIDMIEDTDHALVVYMKKKDGQREFHYSVQVYDDSEIM